MRRTWSMTTGLSTLLSIKLVKVTFLTMPLPTPEPAHALMRAPFWALLMWMLLGTWRGEKKWEGGGGTYMAVTFSTISNMPANWPSDLRGS